jgi:ABC-type sugar transport system ATPase subunit
MSTTAPAVRFEKVTKRFPGVLAVEEVSFEIDVGSCHALCGENGAGKSTLGKMLAGIHPIDGGRLFLFGEEVRFHGPADARAAGVGMVHQELAFAENLTVAENLCLGAIPHRMAWVSWKEMAARARKMLASIDAKIDVERKVGELTLGEQQMVQIAGAVGSGAKIVVFDEPTSSLSQGEVERLYELMARLRAQGVTTVYVSHRMPEIYKLCDTITVLRDGRHVTTRATADLDEAALVQAMIGRRLEEYHPAYLDKPTGDEVLRVERLTSPGKFANVSFSVRAGEVVGLAGLVGAGRSEIAQAIFGLDPDVSGRIFLRGAEVAIGDPITAMRLGIGLVPEDRKRQGLVLGLPGRENLTLPTLDGSALSRAGFIRLGAERAISEDFYRKLRVRAPHVDFVVAGMSGGNQQKVVLAKWLAAQCKLLFLDEPTRGVDVGAKAEIHDLVDKLAASGAAVVLISSELPEVLKLAKRVLVLRNGKLVGELPRAEATQEAIMRLMGGVATPAPGTASGDAATAAAAQSS